MTESLDPSLMHRAHYSSRIAVRLYSCTGPKKAAFTVFGQVIRAEDCLRMPLALKYRFKKAHTSLVLQK